MRFVFLLIVFTITILLTSCSEENAPIPPSDRVLSDTTLEIACPYVTATSVELVIHYRRGGTIELLRNGIRILKFSSLYKDTVFTDQRLTPDVSYVFTAQELSDEGEVWKRDTMRVRTYPISTRSLAFRELGPWGGGLAYAYTDVKWMSDGRLAFTGGLSPLVIFRDDRVEFQDTTLRASGIALDILPDETIVVSATRQLCFYSAGMCEILPLAYAESGTLNSLGDGAVVLARGDGKILRGDVQGVSRFMNPVHHTSRILDLCVRNGVVYALIYDEKKRAATLWRNDGSGSVPILSDGTESLAPIQIADQLFCVWVSPSETIYVGGRRLYRVTGQRVTRMEGFPHGLPSSGLFAIDGLTDADFMIVGEGPFFYHFDGDRFRGEIRGTSGSDRNPTARRVHLTEKRTVILVNQYIPSMLGGSTVTFALHAD